MPWVAAIAAAVGVGASVYGAKTSSGAAKKAARAEEAASQRAIDIQERRFEEGRAALQPYARQEQAASTQLMAQMGLAPPPGGGVDVTGAPVGGFGFGEAPRGTSPQERSMSSFLGDMISEQMAILSRGGMDNDTRAIAEGGRLATQAIREMKSAGQLPADFKEPTQAEWSSIGQDMLTAHGGMKSLRRGVGDVAQKTGTADFAGLAERYFPGGQAQTQQIGAGQMLDPRTGQPGQRVGMQQRLTAGPQAGAPAAGVPPGAPAPQTAADIMGRAGVEGLPEGFSQQYFEDLMRDPEQDPELAAYLGLTPESLQVGAEYQTTPAYQAAREAGIETVNVGAAGTGSLYSGRRGEALRDVGQQVEQGYYFDAMNRRAEMMGARRGERGAELARRGTEYGAGRAREQSYYNNYMTLLNQLAAPTTTTNIARMGTDIGRDVAGNLMSTARNVGELQIGAANVRGAAAGDIAGGLGELAQSYISRPQQRQQPATEPQPPAGPAGYAPSPYWLS